MNNQNRNENLGPAERIIQALLTYTDHMVHNRPGIVTPDPTSVVGVKWEYATFKEEEVDGVKKKVVYRIMPKAGGAKKAPKAKAGAKAAKKGPKGPGETRVKVGTLWADNTVRDDARHKLAEYRQPGFFPEVAVWMYRQAIEVWKLDNEFAAKWASFAFKENHKDLKVVLAALMLVQSRKGDPVQENGEVVFHDEDYRNVGEAMVLLRDKTAKGLDPIQVLRVRDFLCLPQIAEINRELGFGKSARKPFLGRWSKAVEKWLTYREENPPMLEGLVKGGMKSTVRKLSSHVGFKPTSQQFFEVLGWKQAQAEDGRRTIAIGQEMTKAETWKDLNEEAICQRIMAERPGYKVIVGKVPREVGMTRAVMAAAIEAGSLSDKDLIMATPTLEELGLLQVQDIKDRWALALRRAEDQRALNVAKNVKTKDVQDKLQEAGDTAVQKAVEEVVKGLRVYFFVDVSSSMANAIDAAMLYIERFLGAFPLDQLHVAIFNTAGREIVIPHRSAAGVRQAFKGKQAGGGTSHGAGVMALAQRKPKEDEDALFIFIGDEEENGTFEAQVRQTGINPLAFGLIRVRPSGYKIVQDTAARLGIPCFMIDERIFADVYAIPRTIRALVAATPVGVQAPGRVAPARVTLVDQILKTDLLAKPVWA